MKLQDYIKPMLKWWWMIGIAVVIAGVSSYLVTRPLPPVYQAKTTLYVGRAISDPNPDSVNLHLGEDLAVAYADLVKREPAKDAVKQALSLPELPEYTARGIPNSALLEIAVVDTNPERARSVAAELANQLIRMSPTSAQNMSPERQAFIEKQLNDTQAQLDQVAQELNQKQEDLKSMTSALQIADAQDEITALQQKQGILQTYYASLLENSRQGASNQLQIMEPAATAKKPIGPNKPLIILLVTGIALVLSTATAYLLEYLDRTLRTKDDIQRTLDLPVLGFISEMEPKKAWTYVADHPRSPIAEAFRNLRTNIEFSAVDKPITSVLVTSPDTDDGKTTVATNLALILAQGEKKTVLIDVDLRKPSMHERLRIPAQPGLTDVFRENLNVMDVLRAWKDKGIKIITSGSTAPNPAELLGSKRMEHVLQNLTASVDAVVLDAPPLIVTDSVVLSRKVDAVLLVLRPGETKEEVAKAMVEQLRKAGANVIGVVLNRLPRRSAEAYGGYINFKNRYYHAGYFDEPNEKSKGKPPASTPSSKPATSD